MEIEKIVVDGREMEYIVSSDDEVEENELRFERDTLDLTDVVEEINKVTGSSDINE